MLAFALIVGTVVCFVWGRIRYDLVAMGALLAGVLLGVIPAKHAFDGFRNDVVIIIAMALVVSAAFARSGLVEALLRPVLARFRTEATQVPALVGSVALLSMATKNVGALAIMMPVALQAAKRTGASPSRLLMPMSFASLLGGLVTLVGTSPNIIVSEVRQQALGKPFGMYDFAPVGLCLTALGLVFLAFAYRVLPRNRQPEAALSGALQANSYVTEAVVPDDWTPQSMRVGQLRAASHDEVKIAGLVRDGVKRADPHPNTVIRPGDIVLLEGEQEALQRLLTACKLRPHRANHHIERQPMQDVRSVEVVVGAESALIGQNASRLNLQTDHGVKLLAIARAGQRFTQRLRAATLRAGDVLVLRGSERVLPGALSDLGVLPLAEREVRLGARPPRYLAAGILAAAMLLVAFKIVPVAIAFFGAAIAMVVFRAIPIREAYGSLEGPVLVLIAALIPVSEALQSTGGTDLIANALSVGFKDLPPVVALGALMAVAMVSAPFLHNAPTVLILGPVAIGLAQRLHVAPDPLLMAVATGAACDFLTPIGHQCNTLVMGPGGYRFSDYPRLGAPLSLMVLLLGPPIIAFFWPLAAG
jgi:di/tricarboxylate transporter